MNLDQKAINLHKRLKGKIEVKTKPGLKLKENLSLAYTPGVAAVSRTIRDDVKRSWDLTNRKNMVAIVTDGTAILGLGDIGPEAGMPVMEGKAAIFKEFADIDAVPLCINTTDENEIIKFCKYIEPSFGGINLEDISAPRCFTILKKLEAELKIPVFHDDQDGTAIVVLAALINACRATDRVLNELKVVINGAGAAGLAIARLLLVQGVKDIIVVDSQGIIDPARKGINIFKKEIAKKTNPRRKRGSLKDALEETDVFIGVSQKGLLKKEMIRLMNEKPIIFAMANPEPEIIPKDALVAGACIVGTGRSDYPNQINNALVFPGIFKGLLEGNIRKVTDKIKTKAAISLAYVVKNPKINNILPKITDKNVPLAISRAVKSSKR